MPKADLNEEIFKALNARIVLADTHLLAAALILGGLRRTLPQPEANNVAAAQGDLEAKWVKHPAACELPRLPSPQGGEAATKGAALVPAQLETLESALEYLDADDYIDWVELGMALRPLGDQGKSIWLAWSEASSKFDPVEAEAKWKSFQGSENHWRRVLALAQARGWTPEEFTCQ